MEIQRTNQALKLSETGSKGIDLFKEIKQSEESKRIGDCTNEEITTVFRYIFALIGLRPNLLPQGEAKDLLIYFVQKRLLNERIDELKLSFTYAVEKRTEVDLKLFGDTFSANMVMDVFDAYKKYKKGLKQIEKKEHVFKNNYEISGTVLGGLSKETIEYLNKIGEEKPKPKEVIREKTEQELICQDILKEFDVLYRTLDYEITVSQSIRMVEYLGNWLTQDKFLQLRLEEMNKI